jgi:hypothetical protein
MIFLRLPLRSGSSHVFEVDVRYLADSTTKNGAATLYRDGLQVSRANSLPATFPVSCGVIEVAMSPYGLKRMHYVCDDGSARTLRPHPRSHEGLRSRFGRRFPRTGSLVGAMAVVLLPVGLAVSIPQSMEALTRVPSVAERVGTFTSPISLPEWANNRGARRGRPRRYRTCPDPSKPLADRHGHRPVRARGSASW